MIELSVVIVSYNTKKLLEDCLTSLFNSLRSSQRLEKSEVIIVDNHSQDGTLEMISKNFPATTLIKNHTNIGFGAANNIGINCTKGKYVLLLNSDTKLYQETIKNALLEIEKSKDIGVVGAKLLNKDLSVQESCGYFPTLIKVFYWMFFLDDLPILKSLIKPYHVVNSPDFYHKKQDVDWVTGAFFLLRKEVINDSGLFDEKVFMYAEEVEYCYRIKRSGWRIIYSPNARLIHLKGGSASSDNIAGILEEFSGLKYFYNKHYRKIYGPLLNILLYLGALFRAILFGIIKDSGKRRNTYLQYLKLAG